MSGEQRSGVLQNRFPTQTPRPPVRSSAYRGLVRHATLTIGDLLDYFRPGAADELPRWPPDAFALALSILRDADAYAMVVSKWPPGRSSPEAGREWASEMRGLGLQWRRMAGAGGAVPERVGDWWQAIVTARAMPIQDVREHGKLWSTLLELVATADEASIRAGIRISDREQWQDAFAASAFDLLVKRQTLSRSIDPSRAVIFPKVHTPQRGITARSLSHHLALHEPRDVVPRWFPFPYGWGTSPSLNVLVLPWPQEVAPSDFRQTEGLLLNMPKTGHGPRSAYGFFTYDRGTAPVTLACVRSALRKAERLVGRIDAIVFPELSLRTGQCEALCRALKVIVIGGEGAAAKDRRSGSNHAVVSMPLRDIRSRQVGTTFRQPKHHRWCMDAQQIQNYGLGAQLDPRREWWEHIAIERRTLHFFEVSEWLNFCVLICEDLARQDPVSELIRAVGPNLVVALLMDGPQLEHRWAAKYATVLAEDPGCSVLTVTSLGMARLSRPPKKPVSHAVALWKDPISGAVEIDISNRDEGAVLCLTREPTRERTADGREDRWASDYIRLNGVHFVPRG